MAAGWPKRWFEQAGWVGTTRVRLVCPHGGAEGQEGLCLSESRLPSARVTVLTPHSEIRELCRGC